MVELIVVIAIIAVLSAMILPNLLSGESNKVRVTDAARDYFVAAQRVFSKFAKYESDVSGAAKDSKVGDYVVCYDKVFGGNRAVNDYIFIYVHYDNGKIREAGAYSSNSPEYAMAKVLTRTNRLTRNEFEGYDNMILDGDPTTNPPPYYGFLRMYIDETTALFEAADGFYYALVEYDKTLGTGSSAGNNVLKVIMTGYGDYELPEYTGTLQANNPDTATEVNDFRSVFDPYKTTHLLVTDLGKISTGDYFGIQSSATMGDGIIGDIGSYFVAP